MAMCESASRFGFSDDQYGVIQSGKDLRDQMRRCAVSVPSNIAEGAERTGDRDSAQFFVVAKGSLAELQTQAEIAMEVGLMTQTAATEIIEESAEIARMLGAIIHRLKKQ